MGCRMHSVTLCFIWTGACCQLWRSRSCNLGPPQQEVNGHRAAKKEVAQLRKDLEAAARGRGDVQRLEEQLTALRAANTSLKASDGKRLADRAAASDEGAKDADVTAEAARLRQKVQVQAIELKSVAKALAEKEQLLNDFRHYSHRTGSEDDAAQRIAVRFSSKTTSTRHLHMSMMPCWTCVGNALLYVSLAFALTCKSQRLTIVREAAHIGSGHRRAAERMRNVGARLRRS